MDIKSELIEKRNELVFMNNSYNDQLSSLRNLRDEVEELKRTKDVRIDKVRAIYWAICFLIMLLQNIIDLGGIQHIIAWLGISGNAMFLFRGTGKIRKEIKDKEEELTNLEKENFELYELVFNLRSEVHRLAEEVEKMPILALEDKYKNVIQEVETFEIGEENQTPVMKLLSLN